MSIIIEQGIPLPPRQMNKDMDFVRKMQIGESFVWPVNERRKVLNLSYYIKIKLVTRKINETEMRVWRVA